MPFTDLPVADDLPDSEYIYLGVDPGKKGALVFLYPEGFEKPLAVEDMPIEKDSKDIDEPLLRELIMLHSELLHFEMKCRPLRVFVEYQQAVRFRAKSGQRQISGAGQMFVHGTGYGLVRGMLSGMGHKYTIVHPRRWQTPFFNSISPGEREDDPKKNAKYVVRRDMPLDFLVGKRGGLSDGRADAALIARWGREYGNPKPKGRAKR